MCWKHTLAELLLLQGLSQLFTHDVVVVGGEAKIKNRMKSIKFESKWPSLCSLPSQAAFDLSLLMRRPRSLWLLQTVPRWVCSELAASRWLGAARKFPGQITFSKMSGPLRRASGASATRTPGRQNKKWFIHPLFLNQERSSHTSQAGKSLHGEKGVRGWEQPAAA